MNLISIAALLIAAHSVIMAIYIAINPEWYYAKAIRADIEPNMKAAIITKLIFALISGAIGIWMI